MCNRPKRERVSVPVQLMTVHQGEEGLEHELVRLGGGQTVVGQRQQSGFKDREVAHARCSVRPSETSCTAVHPQ